MPAWLIWALAAVLLAVGEIVTPGLFFLGPVALAAVVAGVAAAVGFGVVVQLVLFIAGSIASVGLLRPIARRHEQLAVTTLRNVIGGKELEETLTSRDDINAQLRGVLDEATGKWGIRVSVELKRSIRPRRSRTRWRSRCAPNGTSAPRFSTPRV
jgi:membrane protein implicated in regulation of membrane protease activity